ncbi:hypothetical protein NQ318_005098 [Aromia moschata]|uniref:Mos1 transposase HTH domain-containing protein n=1 Tax=Aromia moschata TaxID=1265417 RepID=A0AAV8YDX4_9CUCU|nr:hypothetical protein NQ318_005098 [Aromia moschata]
MSDVNFEQRRAIRFCFRLGHSATDTFARRQHSYGDSVFSSAQVFRWFKAFSEGRLRSIDEEPRREGLQSSRTDENVNRVRDLVLSDLPLTTRMVGEELNLIHTTSGGLSEEAEEAEAEERRQCLPCENYKYFFKPTIL